MNKNHNQNKLMLKKIGILCACVGGVLTAIGLIDFFVSFGSFGTPKLFWTAFVGLPLLGVGLRLLIVGNTKEIATFYKNETVPVINDAANELRPAIKAFAGVLKDGVDELQSCPNCSMHNTAEAKFCSRCGTKVGEVNCEKCDSLNDSQSNFCNNCGEKI